MVLDTRLELECTEAEVRAAMRRFESTVTELEHPREHNGWDDLDQDDPPDEATRDERDLRWDCPARDYNGR